MFRAKLNRANRDISRQSDVLLVIGDGDCMIQDLSDFLMWDIEHDAAALGRCIKHYPGYVRHWMNADGETAIHWAKNLINGEGTIRHTMGEVDGFDCDWDIEQPNYNYCTITGETNVDRMHGSSAMFATLAGIEMGYSKIVLAGCPMDMNGHWYFPDKNKDTLGPIWIGADFMAWIDFSEQKEAVRVRSMSGYTAKILGRATREWVNEL